MERINKNNKDVGMTAEDLKSQMFRSMKSSGVLQHLKSQLRQSMINELRGKPKIGDDLQTSDLLAATIKNKTGHSWIQQAVDNLFLQHIKQSKYQYTLSLFQQESGLDIYDSSLTDKLLSRLGVSDIPNLEDASFNNGQPKSSTPRSSQNKSSDILLYKILEGLATANQKEEKENISAIKPDDKKPLTLAEKLKAVDDDVIGKRKQFAPSISVTTLSEATKKAEEASERRAKIALQQWKALELARMRVDEAKAYKDKLDTRLHCLENDFQIKRNALLSRERSAIDRLNSQRESMEKEMHEQRQSLLFELEKIKSKEDTLSKREQLLHEMEAVQLAQKHETNPAPLIGKDIPEATTNQGRESFVSSIADSSKNSYSKKQVITSNDINAILEEVNVKSQYIESLKHEISELKKDLAFDRSLRKTNANAESNQLRAELNDLKIALESLTGAKNQTLKSSTSTSKAEKLELKVSQLEAKNREEVLQKNHLEDMLKQMKLAMEDSNNALLYLSNAREPTNIPSLNQNNNISVQRDAIRDYEPLNEDSFQFSPVLSGSTYVDVTADQPTGVRLDIRQRIKDLEIQSDRLDEEYNRYINTNYKQLLEQQSKSRTHSKPRYNEYSFYAPKNNEKRLGSNRTTPQPTGRLPLKQHEVQPALQSSHQSQPTSKNSNHTYSNEDPVRSETPPQPSDILNSTNESQIQESGKLSSSPSSTETSVENKASLRLGELIKTSSDEESRSSDSSPKINTVRKLGQETETEKTEPLRPLSSIGAGSTLPPITMKRALPSLPDQSIKPESVSESSNQSISKKGEASLNEIFNSKASPNLDKSNSVISYEESVNTSVSSKLSNKGGGDKEEKISVDEASISSSNDSGSNALKEEDLYLSSESSKSHPSKQNKNSQSGLGSEISPPKDPLVKQQSSVKVDRYSFNARPYYQTDETITNDISGEGTADSISDDIEEILEKSDNNQSESDPSKQESLDFSKPQPKKPPAYNLESNEGIDAMLKWGEENQPELHYSDDSFHSDQSSSKHGKPQMNKVFSSYKDDHSDKENAEVDIFDVSHHSYINDDDSKHEVKESSSNDSW